MASIRRFGLFNHFKAELNEHVLFYQGGKLVQEGPGIAFWYLPLSASLAQVPAEDQETTFVVKALTRDLQETSVQVSVVYRARDPRQASQRVNFSIDPHVGRWLETPLEKIANILAKKSIQPVRDYLAQVEVVPAMVQGPKEVRDRLLAALGAEAELADLGLSLVDVHVTRIAPAPEMEKAIQTPSREAIQQKADEAVFSRRAQAVDKERAIKENELSNEIELARRQEQLIQRNGDNRRLEAQRAGEASKVAAESAAEVRRLESEAQAAALRAVSEAENEAEARKVDLYKNAPTSVALGFAARALADKLQSINNLNVTPDLLGDLLQRLATGDGAKP